MAIPARRSGGGESASKRGKLFPEGTYEAIIVNAVEKPSKSSGKDMLELDIEIEHDGVTKSIKEYVVFFSDDVDDKTGEPLPSWKLENFLDAITVPTDPEALPPSSVIGRRMMVDVVIEPASGKFRAKERVDRMDRHKGGPVIPEGELPPAAPAPATTAAAMGVAEEDLPF